MAPCNRVRATLPGLCAVSLAPLLALVLARAHAAAPVGRITIYVRHVIGPLKPLRGVNGAPNLTFLGPVDSLGHPRINVSAGYRAAHIDLVRTHDSEGLADIDPHIGPLRPLVSRAKDTRAARMDLRVMFPRLSANPDLAASYQFGPTDALVAGIRSIGAQVLFRLGREGMTTAPPPTDLRKYGQIIRHIALHYERGWDHGMLDGVRYWEVWNEPDLGKIWWRGTPQQYYALYATAARAVKSADPRAFVGGPTIAMVNEPTPYRDGFLEYVQAHRLPLDFFSWHWYSVGADDPYDFNRIAVRMRALLDRYGFRNTRSFLDEWNYDFREMRSAPPMQVASFVASALAYMQNAPIDREALYRADGDFLATGRPRTPTGQVLVELGRFVDTPLRVATVGADTDGLAVQAARSRDGRILRVLISNYRIPTSKMGARPGGDTLRIPGLFTMRLLRRRTIHYPQTHRYVLTIRGLPQARYRVIQRRLGERGEAVTTTHPPLGSTVTLDVNLPPYAVETFEIVRAP